MGRRRARLPGCRLLPRAHTSAICPSKAWKQPRSKPSEATDATGWLYAARGYYKVRQYHSVIECVAPALRNERTRREAQHLLAFALMYTGQHEASCGAFLKSIALGNETDWQPLVELVLDNPSLQTKT